MILEAAAVSPFSTIGQIPCSDSFQRYLHCQPVVEHVPITAASRLTTQYPGAAS